MAAKRSYVIARESGALGVNAKGWGYVILEQKNHKGVVRREHKVVPVMMSANGVPIATVFSVKMGSLSHATADPKSLLASVHVQKACEHAVVVSGQAVREIHGLG